ncbi:adenylate/guanylate cyclase domain-containing protein [Nostoc sp. FACHB-280]|uniref:adenylate/guanylate cyclase domain-containing protein n=1 Tax=Nostoc sp. FACHB-280 TaxID=2692839 RepID=UPI00168B980A|nr:adenylate/guanylate cyclase domain-containing protein [Nostoc sp. FACHB-280]MBD2494330.1 PAS domain S-box protein [Nostoc sp. FACHB-280]
MKYEVVEQIFNKYSTLRKFEYLELDIHFRIVDKSEQVHRFAMYPNAVMFGTDIRVAFPEFVGKEDILKSIIQGQQEIFELEIIRQTTDTQANIYINIYIIGESQEKLPVKKLIVFLEDVTETTKNKQDLSKITNATSLLSMMLVTYKNYMETVIRSMADALLITTNTGKIKQVNLAAQKLFDFSEAELINQPISLLFEDNFSLLRIINHYSKLNRDLQQFEVVCRKKTREKMLVAFSCTVMQRKNEALEDIIYIGRDVTSRQRREQRNVAQYQITRILSESSSIQQAIPEILQAICQSLEWDVGELWTASEYITTDVPAESDDAVLRCVEMWSSRLISAREFKAVTWQTTYLPNVGLPGQIWGRRSAVWNKNILDYVDLQRSPTAINAGLCSAFGFPILDDNKILGVMTFFSRDIQPQDADLLQMMVSVGSQVAQFMKRKQAEEKLLESELRYRDICENANDLIQSVNVHGQFLYVNRKWYQTLGYSADEVQQMNVFEIIHPDYQAHCRQTFSRLMSGEKVEQVKTAFIAKNGQTVFLEGNINCRFSHGLPVATRGIFRNITQRVYLEIALQQQQAQTEQFWQARIPTSHTIASSIDGTEVDLINVTVLCADIVGLNEIAASGSAMQLVSLLCPIFAAFDRLCNRYGLEKVKTINEAYIVIGGLPTKHPDHTQAIAQMALDMQAAIATFNIENQQNLKICIGIHTGVVTTAALGLIDTINIARILQTQSVADTIQVSTTVYEQIYDEFILEPQDEIEIPHQQKIATYLLRGQQQENRD